MNHLQNEKKAVTVRARKKVLHVKAEPAESSRFEGMDDAKVAMLANQEDSLASEYLLNKYKNFVRAKARTYFLVGADREDLIQEGMIGLFKAIRDFLPDKQVSFRAFAELCITRQIITAIKAATRQKHKPLNSYVSLNKPVFDEESDRMLVDIITSAKVLTPEDIIIDKEDIASIEEKIGEMLSGLERDVLRLYLMGRSYQQIALQLDRRVKSIDNALQRVKSKLEKHLEAERAEELRH